MLGSVAALLLMQAEIQKAPVAAPAPTASGEAIGKAQVAAPAAPATPAFEACVEMPDPAYRGARAMSWYIDSEVMQVAGKAYLKYGLPRVLTAWEIEYHANAGGGLFYAERGVEEAEVLYLLVDPAGCEFQPYQRDG